MITLNRLDGRICTNHFEMCGLSTDEKPIENITNGSLFYEMNTQERYCYDAENEMWIQLPKPSYNPIAPPEELPTNEYILFSNDWNQKALVDGFLKTWMYYDSFDTTHLKDYNNSLLGTPNMLFKKQQNGTRFHVLNEMVTRNSASGNFTSFTSYIPLKRINVEEEGWKYLTYDAKTISNTGTTYNHTCVGVGMIDSNGTLVEKIDNNHGVVSNWTTFILEIPQNIKYIDYVIFIGVDGAPAYKNIKLLKELD